MFTDRFPALAPTDMTRRRFCEAALSALAVGIPPIHDFALPGDRQQTVPIPSLDELATEWLSCAQVAHMPSMHNFYHVAACGPDLVGVNFLPGHRIYKASGPRWFIYNTLSNLSHLDQRRIA